MRVVEGESGLSRKVYTITEAGRQVLGKWVHESMEADASLKTFLMRLMFADTLSREALLTHLEQRRSQLSNYQTALEQASDATGDNGDLGGQLAFDYGRVMSAAETVWLERKLAQLCPPPRKPAVEESGSI
jgi:hypothetical protein